MLENALKIYVDGFVFCHCTSTEGTYHRQFGKCTLFPIFRLWTKILSFQKLILKNTYYWILIYYLIFGKYLEPRKELSFTICVGKTPAKMLDWCKIWPFIMIFMDVNYHIFTSKIIITKIRLCKEKHMLDYFSCYTLNNNYSPILRKENFNRVSNCQCS